MLQEEKNQIRQMVENICDRKIAALEKSLLAKLSKVKSSAKTSDTIAAPAGSSSKSSSPAADVSKK